MLLWIFIYKLLCGHLYSFLLGIYPGVERDNFLQCFFPSYLERGRGTFLGDVLRAGENVD